MSMLGRSLATRFILAIVLVTIVVVAVCISQSCDRIRGRLQEQAFHRARAHATAVGLAVETLGRSHELQRFVAALGGEQGVASIVVVRADTGDVIAATPGILAKDRCDELPSGVRARLDRIVDAGFGMHTDETADHFVMSRSVRISGGDLGDDVAGAVDVRLDAAPIRHAIDLEVARQARVSILVVAGVISFFIIMYLVLVARRTREIALVMEATEAGARGVRCRVAADDELGRIASGLNGMLDVLEREEFDRIQRTEVLGRAKRAAVEASRSKSVFLANMSHEIRTPMTAILGFSELLATRTEQSAEARRWTATIRRNGEHLLAIIDDILDVSKIEAGRIELDTTEFSLDSLVDDVVELMNVQAREKDIALRVGRGDGIPELVTGDPIRVRQILVNLLANAIKFTSVGFVGLDVGWRPTNSRTGLLVVRVTDSGVGMTAAELDRVFSPFTQADPSVTRRFGGTGLGLTICRSLAQLMDGTIDAESTPEVGTTITVRIPFGVVELDEFEDEIDVVQVKDSNDLHGMRILVAEDGADIRVLTRAILEGEGADVEFVSDGGAAIAAIDRAVAAGCPYDLALMDMQMPGLDGYEATRRIRAAGRELPIVAFTAHAMAGDADKCIAVGCDDHVSKPIDNARLFAVCSRFAPARAAENEGVHA